MDIGRFSQSRFALCSAAALFLAGAVFAEPALAGSDISTKTDPKLNSLLPAKLKEAGQIRVASNVEYPPFEYYDTDNKTIIGLDKDLADALGQKLGVKLEFENMSFDAVIPALAANRYDMAMSAMTDTDERRKKVDFVDYFSSGGGFLVKQGNPKGIHGLGDICGISVAIDKGTTEIDDAQKASDDCVKAGKPAVDAKVLPGTSQIVLALQAGRADVAMIDTSAGAYIAQQHKGAFEVPGTSYAPRSYGLVLPKGSDELTKALQASMQALIDEGTYGKILEKWGQQVGAIKKATINDGK